jgi:hypothetical protein
MNLVFSGTNGTEIAVVAVELFHRDDPSRAWRDPAAADGRPALAGDWIR